MYHANSSKPKYSVILFMKTNVLFPSGCLSSGSQCNLFEKDSIGIENLSYHVPTVYGWNRILTLMKSKLIALQCRNNIEVLCKNVNYSGPRCLYILYTHIPATFMQQRGTRATHNDVNILYTIKLSCRCITDMLHESKIILLKCRFVIWQSLTFMLFLCCIIDHKIIKRY